MRRKLYALVFALAAAAAVASSPAPLNAQADLNLCPCNGGCEDRVYYNDCGNGMCSWFCQASEE